MSHHSLQTGKLLCPAIIMAAAFAGACMGGCNTQGCTDNHSALPLMGFYSGTTGARMMLDSLDLSGVDAPNDTLLVHSGQSVNSLYLPFRYDSNETAFCFHYDYPEQGLDDPALNDTITFGYTTEPYFASEECGAFYIYTIRDLKHTTHLIEKVEIVDSIINNVDMERIKVYFRVAELQPPESGDNPDNPDNPDAPDVPDIPDEPDTPGESDSPAGTQTKERRPAL